MTTLVLKTTLRPGIVIRALTWFRSLSAKRILFALGGIPSVVLEGRVYAVTPVPLGIARELVPAMLRCSRKFAAWQVDEELYDDLVKVLSLGLRTSPETISRLTVALWELAPVIEQIATANAMPVLEAGRSDLGKLIAALSTGESSTPGLLAPQDGLGNTSTSS